VRLAHWMIVLALTVLAVTGAYMHDPFIVAFSHRALGDGHGALYSLAGGVTLTAAFIWRFYWFFAGNRFANWRQFIPLAQSRRDGMGGMLKYYLFLRWWPRRKWGTMLWQYGVHDGVRTCGDGDSDQGLRCSTVFWETALFISSLDGYAV